MFLKFKYCFWFIISIQGLKAQVMIPSVLTGKVIADATDLEGINIKNLKSDYSTKTNSDGIFSITANVGDTLSLSAIQFKKRKIILKKEDFNTDLFLVKLENSTLLLNEVKIMDYKNINAINLGITKKGQKKYTAAERKLYTATGGGNQLGTNTAISVDAILNAISGRTTMLKKELKVEQKEFTMNKLNNWFDDSFFIEKLKIPKEYVNGFKYYSIENVEFVQDLNKKNYALTTFLINNLSLEYLNIVNTKNKI